MNCYRYEQLLEGQTEGFSVTITAELQQMFLAMSGDVNPMHTDDAYSRRMGYDAPLVYGMLTASFYSTLVGTYLPGKYCLFQEADIRFTSPVFVGDTLRIEGEITGKDDRFRRVTIKARIKNQEQKTVSRAVLKVGVLSE